MDSTLGKITKFPKFLPKPNEELLKWLGERLVEIRKKKTVAQVAKAAKVSVEEIEKIEKGIIHQDVGHFRHILRRGYNRKLEDLLSKCYVIFEKQLNPSGKRRFERDYYYSLCLHDQGKKESTPLLVGGDPQNYIWAVPFRRLIKQPLCVDLLELAPNRIKKKLGQTGEYSHDGVEVVHVIRGSVTVSIDTDSEGSDRTLLAGDSIHFTSNQEHQIRNKGSSTPALLQIVRLPEL